jgi:hypothetical protein
LKKYNAFKKWRETKNIPTRPKHQSWKSLPAMCAQGSKKKMMWPD